MSSSGAPCRAPLAAKNQNASDGPEAEKEDTMANWKCSNCGYELEAAAPPDQCPSCRQKCEFLDNSCYTPDCQYEGVDKRIK